MIDELEFIQMVKIDKERLFSYYNRIKSQFHSLTPIQIVAKFLNGHSIGNSMKEVLIVLEYYKNKLTDNKKLLDFAFEWIRASQIRFHYIKYLGNAQFPDFEIAIDACIFLFFEKYDRFLRSLFKKDIYEFEISSLHNIFFFPIEGNFNFKQILEEQKNRAPTIFRETNRIDVRLFTLRSGLSNIIRNDFNKTKFGI